MEIEVTQADREAAARLATEIGDDWIAAPILAGERDNRIWVQAFARHRIAAIKERDAQIVAWLRERAAEYRRLHLTFQASECENIADAIERGEV